MTVQFEWTAAGYCRANKRWMLRGAKPKQLRCYAGFGIIRHLQKGVVLFDTGYTERFFTQTRHFPARLYAATTPVRISKHQTAAAQLKQRNIDPASVQYVIISHFHADHIGGLCDFPNAKFICSRPAYDHFEKYQGLWSFRKGYLPGLLPADFKSRVKLVDFNNATKNHHILGATIDLFGDSSLCLFQLEGHACGQMGAWIRTSKKEICLIADACWLKDNYQKNRLPHSVVRVIVDNWNMLKINMQRLNVLFEKNPEVLIIPSHCEETLQALKGKIF